MRFSPALVLALGLACMPKDDAAEQPDGPAPGTASKPAPVEAEPNPIGPNPGNEWFLGFVSQTGVEHCASEFEPTWLAVQSTLGFISTSGQSLDAWMAKPVLATGQAIPAPKLELAPETTPKPCPIMQMRSDWVNTPQGLRIDHQGHPAIEHFFVSSAEPLTQLVVTREGDELVVEFTNPLPFELAEFAMTIHYEGCYGKPGSTQQSRAAKPLAVGERRTERFPMLAEQTSAEIGERKGGPAAHVHLAKSLELSAKPGPGAPTLHVDLDAPFAAFGVSLECPD